jgi:hypothetical protein
LFSRSIHVPAHAACTWPIHVRTARRCSHVPRHVSLSTPCIFTYVLHVEVSRALIKEQVINEVINIHLGSLALNVKGMPLCTPAGVFFVVYTHKTLPCTFASSEKLQSSTGMGDVYSAVHVLEILLYISQTAPRHATPRRCRACLARAAAPLSVATATYSIQLIRLSLSDLPCAARTTPRLPTWTSPTTASRCFGSHTGPSPEIWGPSAKCGVGP